MDHIVTEEGRAVYNRVDSSCVYFVKDLQIAFKNANSVATVLQTNDFYPFKPLIQEFNDNTTNKNKYLYNRKELDKVLIIQMYDYGARMYDPQLGRWHSIDPSAHKYSDMSPYNYGFNSPINVVDPDGRDCIFTIQRNKKGEIIGINISSTIHITGEGASVEKAKELNKMSGDVYKSNIQSNVNISYNINFEYNADINKDDLKKGDNILYFDKTDRDGNQTRSHVSMPGMGGHKYTTNEGQILPNEDTKEWENYSVFHESSHLLGLSDRYAEGAKNAMPVFTNDIMTKWGSYNIGDTHYRDYYNYGTGLARNYPGHKRFVNYILIDYRNGSLTNPTQKQLEDDGFSLPQNK